MQIHADTWRALLQRAPYVRRMYVYVWRMYDVHMPVCCAYTACICIICTYVYVSMRLTAFPEKDTYKICTYINIQRWYIQNAGKHMHKIKQCISVCIQWFSCSWHVSVGMSWNICMHRQKWFCACMWKAWLRVCVCIYLIFIFTAAASDAEIEENWIGYSPCSEIIQFQNKACIASTSRWSNVCRFKIQSNIWRYARYFSVNIWHYLHACRLNIENILADMHRVQLLWNVHYTYTYRYIHIQVCAYHVCTGVRCTALYHVHIWVHMCMYYFHIHTR